MARLPGGDKRHRLRKRTSKHSKYISQRSKGGKDRQGGGKRGGENQREKPTPTRALGWKGDRKSLGGPKAIGVGKNGKGGGTPKV